MQERTTDCVAHGGSPKAGDYAGFARVVSAQDARLEFNILAKTMDRALVTRFETDALTEEDRARPDVQVAMEVWRHCVVTVPDSGLNEL